MSRYLEIEAGSEFSKQHTTAAYLRTHQVSSKVDEIVYGRTIHVRSARRFTVGPVYTVFRLPGTSYHIIALSVAWFVGDSFIVAAT